MTATRTTAGIATILNFTFEKETKGAIRYKEELDSPLAEGLAEGVLGTIYIRKNALARMGHKEIPKSLTITLEV